MANWIPFGEGNYLVERALLIAPDNTAVVMENSAVEVRLDAQGTRRMDGYGTVQNILVVQLLEEHDTLDLLLDLGEEFKFLLKDPFLQAGKVFSPEVKSILRFAPSCPLEHVSEAEFADLFARMKLLP